MKVERWKYEGGISVIDIQQYLSFQVPRSVAAVGNLSIFVAFVARLFAIKK